MAGSLQPRVKTWSALEDVTYSDLNAEFDNALTAMQPLLIDDYSTNSTQMQVTADPGEVGTESLATTLAGELARIRHMLKEITGENQWYESPVSSLTGLANAVGTGLTDNRLVSGRVRTTSAQPIFLVPNGAARTIKLDGTPTNFIYYIEGVEKTITTDVTLTNLTAAPSSNNTCLINDANAADQYWTKYAGEDGSEIPIDTAGSEITALVGKFAGFKLNNGSTDEYFLAYVHSSTSLRKVRRGYFFDSSDAPIPRITYANNDTITLMKLTWIFAKDDGTLTATYNNPVWSDDEPSSPAVNDYWFDTSANKWKRYDVASYVDADAMLVGICLQDTTNTVAARSFDCFANYDELNMVELILDSNTQVKSRELGSTINVYGETLKFDYNLITWDMTTDLESGVTENASTYYYFYITETGDKIISDKKPHDRREDLQGYYHPSHSWRCVGSAFNNSSSHLTCVNSYYTRHPATPIMPSQTAAANIEVIPRIIPVSTSGGAFTQYLPPAALWKGQLIRYFKTSSDFTVFTITAFGAENIKEGSASATTTTLNTQGEWVDLFSDGTDVFVMMRNIPSNATSYTLTIGATSVAPDEGTGVTKSAYWMRLGRHMRILYSFSKTGGGSAGTGHYLWPLPSGVAIDTTYIPAETGGLARGLCGSAMGRTTNTRVGGMIVYDTTNLQMIIGDATIDPQRVGQTNTLCVLSTAAVSFSFDVTLPITGWKG